MFGGKLFGESVIENSTASAAHIEYAAHAMLIDWLIVLCRCPCHLVAVR